MTSSLGQNNLHAIVVEIMIDRSCCIRATSHTSNKLVGIIASHLLLKLLLEFL